MKEIKEALSKLQNRPWEAKKGAGWFVQLGEAIAIVEQPAVVGMKIEENTAKFIAKSPEYVASLISKVEEMKKALDRIHTDSTDAWAVGYSLRVLQSLKGEPQ